MKRKDILNSLKNEINSCMPDCLNYCKNKRVVREELPSTNQSYFPVGKYELAIAKPHKEYRLSYMIIACVMLLLAVLAITLPLLGLGKKAQDIFSNIMTRVSLDINPSLDMLVDANGNVVTYYPKNSHAELLMKDVSLKNKSVADATVEVVNLAAKAGYIDVTAKPTSGIKNAVLLSIISADDKVSNNLETKLDNTLENYFKQSQIYGVVLTNKNSKQEFATIVEAVTGCQEDLSQKPVKELNKMLADGYKQLEKVYGSQFIRENFEIKCSEIFKNYENQKKEIERVLIELNNQFANFENNWNSLTASLKQQAKDLSANITEKEKLVKQYKQELENLTGNEQVAVQNQVISLLEEINNLNQMLIFKNIEITKHEEKGNAYNQQKIEIVNRLREQETTFNKLVEDHVKIRAHELDVIKSEFPNLSASIVQKREEIFNNTLNVYNQHFNNLDNNVNFESSYAAWKNEQENNILEFKNNWSTKFENYNKQYNDYVNLKCA